MMIIELPAGNVPGPTLAFNLRRELGPNLAGVAVTQLVKHAAMLVENAMVSMDQPEQGVAAVEVGGLACRLGVHSLQPAASI